MYSGMSTIEWRRLVLLMAVIALVLPAVAFAQDATDPNHGQVTRVEEDWVLWVYQPNGDLYAPQFHTVISPRGDLDSYYFQITWNYWEMPGFAPGGFQVQSWQGDRLIATNDIGSAELSRTAEIITWTQVIETNGAQLGFSILNGQSTTWGAFGYPETTVIQDGGSANLNHYSPDVSVANSWITYGANRVIVLRIREVRMYNDDGELLSTDTTSRTVYSGFGTLAQ